jgi:hypothetical protein
MNILATRRPVSWVLWSLAVSMTRLSSTPCSLALTSSSSPSSSPWLDKAAILSLAWKRVLLATRRSRMRCETGTLTGVSVGVKSVGMLKAHVKVDADGGTAARVLHWLSHGARRNYTKH